MQDGYYTNGMIIDEPPLTELEDEYNKLVQENNEALTRVVLERLVDETVFQYLPDYKQKEILEKTVKQVNAVAEAIKDVAEKIHDIINTVVNDILSPLFSVVVKYNEELFKDIELLEKYCEDEFPRIYHLARFAPKERTRKKNRARLFEMIKALYRPGLCS